MLAEYEHPSFGPVRSIGLPLTLGGVRAELSAGTGAGRRRPAILADLGYDDAAVERLRAAGAFGASHGSEPPAVEPG